MAMERLINAENLAGQTTPILEFLCKVVVLDK